MSLSKVRPIYGVHSATMYNRSTRIPYGKAIKVIAGSALTLSGELVKLEGGSFNYAWDVQDGRQTAELVIKAREYPPFLYELFLGKAPTEVAAETDGTLTSPSNVEGSSIIADTGIGSIAVNAATKANLKFTKFVIRAETATTVTVFGYSDQDFHRGTDAEFVDDTMEVLAADLDVTQSTTTLVSGFGIDLLGGSGTIAMTVLDTAVFEALPPSTRSFSVKIGNPTNRTPEFGCYLQAETLGDNRMYAIDAYRCRAAGMPIIMDEKAYSEAEIKAEVFYDQSENAICEIRDITPNSNPT